MTYPTRPVPKRLSLNRRRILFSFPAPPMQETCPRGSKHLAKKVQEMPKVLAAHFPAAGFCPLSRSSISPWRCTIISRCSIRKASSFSWSAMISSSAFKFTS